MLYEVIRGYRQTERVWSPVEPGRNVVLTVDVRVQKAEIIWHNRLNFFPFSKIGKWWDKNEEIDLVVVNPELHENAGIAATATARGSATCAMPRAPRIETR